MASQGLLDGKPLSIGSLMRHFWRQISVTWFLTLLETGLLATLPLLIGMSIDGLLSDSWTSFFYLLGAMALVLLLAVVRRAYDTRAYGTMAVELGDAVTQNGRDQPVSAVNARVEMSHELIQFLEDEAPILLTAIAQIIVSLGVLFAFHGALAASAGGATLAGLLIYTLSAKRFYALNHDMNAQAEQQVAILSGRERNAIRHHLSLLRGHYVRLSDTEAIVYGLIFAVLLAMLGFNLWFAATQTAASPGQIFSIVVYSFEFMESAIALPAAMQSLTRLAEITQRINGEVEAA
ncbi:MAG: ABC transporter six-transmembrane domain-containing protein [Pseudomonadota bacterium]